MDHHYKNQRERKIAPYRESDSWDTNDIEFYDQSDLNSPYTHARSLNDDEFFGRMRCHESIYSRRHPDLNPDGESEVFYEDLSRSGAWQEDERRQSIFSGQKRFSGQAKSHRGKGPKGYKRSSERILEDACDRLMRDSRIDATDVEVEVNDGILILKGEVRTRDEKRRAESLVENLAGVNDVFNQLHTKQQS